MNFLKKPELRQWLYVFLVFALLILFYKFLDYLPWIFEGIAFIFKILRPFVIGFVIAFILYRPAVKIELLLSRADNKFLCKNARILSIIYIYASFLIILGLVLSLAIPRLYLSLKDLITKLPGYYESTMNFINSKIDSDGKLFGFDISDIRANLKLEQFFRTDKMLDYLQGIYKVGSAVVDFMLAMVISMYMLASRESLRKVCRNILSLFLPEHRIQGIKNYTDRICNIFYDYIFSQLLDALVVSIMAGIVFSILGVPYSILLAILMGLCNLIPYFGAIIGGSVVMVITFLSGKRITALIVAAAIIIIQQIDGNIIQPRIVSNKMGLKPLYVLLAITVGGGLFGFVGILFGVPAMAVLRMLLREILAQRQGRKKREN
ncbi:MAG TPA: AI-2E family transporter [Clostridiales bacterium]|nr:AI-2E family transporter [Clostridiales bacterium]